MGIKQVLRPYQVQVGRAVLDSVIHRRGLTFTVEVARQGGKNELSAQMEVLLLTLFMFLAAFVHQLLYYLLLGLAGVAVSPALGLGRIILPTALYTALFVPFLFRYFYRWFYRSRWREQEY